MAVKTAFPPEVMAAMKSQTKFIQQTKKATDPFANFAGPIGRYYGRTQRIGVTFEASDKSPIFTFIHTCLAQAPDASSGSKIASTEFSGAAMRVRISTKATDKSTKRDQWERVHCALQAYGIKTKNFGMRDGVEHVDLILVDMGAAVDLVNERKPAVLIDVTESKNLTTGKVGKFCNVREAIDEELVAKYGKLNVEISDEQLEAFQEDDSEDDGGTSSDTGSETPPNEDEVTALLAGHSTEEIRGSLLEDNVNCGCPIELLTEEQVKAVAFCFMMKQDIPQIKDPSTAAPRTSEVAGAVVLPLPAAQEGSDEEEEEEGEESDEEEEDAEDKILKLQLKIGTLTRDELKKAIKAAGGMKEGEKFKTTQTDDNLRDILFGLKTGKIAPVSVVIPDDIPF